MLAQLRGKMAQTQVNDFWESMKKLGLSAQEIVELIRRQAEEE